MAACGVAGSAGNGAGARRRAGAALPELLAPAGGPDAFLAAIAAGADAVYLGLERFSARATAENFTLADVRRATALAHARGVRVYVALNTSMGTGELVRAVQDAADAVAAGADALIVSDWGLAARLRRELPEAELHLSTQADVHALPGVLLAARELGFARVTTSRELAVAEMAELAASGVDVEVFCHGAICICYSGACELSWRLTGRSALRGLCSQPCRRGYELVDDAGRGLAVVEGDRLLCPRDYCSIRHVPELVRAGVASLKIEGRMKNPDYAYGVVRAYRAALDAVAAGEDPDADRLEFELGRSFNRGFTDAYLADAVHAPGRQPAAGRAACPGDAPSDPFMSYERSMNQGVRVGRVTGRALRDVSIALEQDVCAGDVLEVRSRPDQNEKVVRPKRWSMVEAPAGARAGETLHVEIKRKIEVGSTVHLVRDAQLVAESAAAVERLRPELEALPVKSRAADRVLMADRAQHAGSAARRSASRAKRLLVAPTPDAARAALADAGVQGVYVRAEHVVEDPAAWSELLPQLGVLLGEACRADELEGVRRLMQTCVVSVCRNLSEVALARELGAPFEVAAPLTVCNADAAGLFARLGARRIWLAPEFPAGGGAEVAVGAAPEASADAGLAGLLAEGAREELRALLAEAGEGCEIVWTVWEHPQLMVCETCLLRAMGPCSGSCRACDRRRQDARLRCSDGRELLVRVDGRGRSRLLDAAPRDERPLAPELVAEGVGALVVDAGHADPERIPALLDLG